jgi:carbonic anhydrase
VSKRHNRAFVVIKWAGLCQTGTEQSPIDLTAAYLTQATSSDTQALWTTPSSALHNVSLEYNGHALNVALSPSEPQTNSLNVLEINVDTYQLQGFHFHVPSEHAIDGVKSDAEVHFVHKDTSGNLAVVGVLLNQGDGAENTLDPFLDQFMSQVCSPPFFFCTDTKKWDINDAFILCYKRYQ